MILVAYDENDKLQNLREFFVKILPFPKYTNKFNTIIHTTLARFNNQPNDINHLIEFADKYNKKSIMRVDQMVLRNELIYPSLKAVDIAKINLI